MPPPPYLQGLPFWGYRMPDNDVEGIDYMADEVDILDFVMDDEDANVDGARFAPSPSLPVRLPHRHL
ncbi:hypothetical protein L2E82_52174 [Cichorium intybus]|nr:hypothetical protein L2E82_52174 [Cichorium intybus]